MRFSVRDKVVLITGAASGIGEASALALHAAGARVVLTDLCLQSVEALAERIGGNRVTAMEFDVTDRAAADAVSAAVVDRFGGLDVVFANAGISCDPPTTIARIAEQSFERVIEVNLLGVWRTVRACLPQIIARKGHVLVTASIYAFVNGACNAPYAMSKAGVEMFGRALRAELAGTGATAGVLYPGWVATPLARPAFGGNATATELVALAYPWLFNRPIAPARVADAVLRGLQSRAARIFVPRRWIPLSILRGIVSEVSDRTLDRDPEIHALVRRLEQEYIER